MVADPIEGFFPPETIVYKTISLPVYTSRDGEIPLLVLHELPGMSSTFIDYCCRMIGHGYKVYMPLLFKSPNTRMGNIEMGLFCLSREFRAMFCPDGQEQHRRPFTAWLRHLSRTIVEREAGRRVGVVGMCLTGGFALAGLAEDSIDAVICAQPSMPLIGRAASLAMSATERSAIRSRAQTLPPPCAKGYRYKNDFISRDAHMRACQGILGEHFERYPDLPGGGHSTLTEPTFNQDVFDDVLAFLDARLKT